MIQTQSYSAENPSLPTKPTIRKVKQWWILTLPRDHDAHPDSIPFHFAFHTYNQAVRYLVTVTTPPRHNPARGRTYHFGPKTQA